MHGEAGKVLMNRKNRKRPGSHGYTFGFLKFFWTDLDQYLIKTANFSVKIKLLFITQ